MSKNGKFSVAFLFDDTLDSSDGVAQYVKLVGSWLSDQGHEVSYLVGQTKTTEWAGGRVYSLSRNLKLSWGGNRLSISLLPKMSAIKRLLRQKKFDVLHVMVPYSPFMSQQVIRLASPETAVVGTVHVFPSNRLSRFGSKVLKRIYGHSLGRFDKFVSVSDAAAAYAEQSFGVDSQIIPNTVDLARFTVARASKTNRTKRVVFLGRLVKRKGCYQLLKAFRLLLESVPDAELVIAGSGPERAKYEAFVKKNDLTGKVTFLGYIDEADKPALLAGADIACFPSLYGECFGIVLIEAMAAGSKVVLGGDNPGYRSVLGGQPDLLIKPGDTAAFAARLAKLLSDKRSIDECRRWLKNQAGQYDIKVVGPRIESIYRQAIVLRAKKSNNKHHGRP